MHNVRISIGLTPTREDNYGDHMAQESGYDPENPQSSQLHVRCTILESQVDTLKHSLEILQAEKTRLEEANTNMAEVIHNLAKFNSHKGE